MLQLSLVVHKDCNWSLFAMNRQVSYKCELISKFPANIQSTQSLNLLLSEIDKLSVCCGQPDAHFVEMIRKNQVASSQKEKSKAYVDDFEVLFDGKAYPKTIRTTECELIAQAQKCSFCFRYRSTLRVMHNRYIKQSVDASIFTNNRYLSSLQKMKKIYILQKQLRNALSKIRKLNIKVKTLIESEGNAIHEDLHSDLHTIMKKPE